jgi:TPP-dependent indolepyruvate ferredoxin oxidoreductase alpha subunit
MEIVEAQIHQGNIVVEEDGVVNTCQSNCRRKRKPKHREAPEAWATDTDAEKLKLCESCMRQSTCHSLLYTGMRVMRKMCAVAISASGISSITLFSLVLICWLVAT